MSLDSAWFLALRIFLAVALVVELVARVRHMRRRDQAHKACYAEGRPAAADYLWIALGGGLHYATLTLWIAFFGWIRFAQLPLVPALVIIGCVVSLAGLALILWSHRALGLAFCISADPTPGRRLVTAGPYGLVRHPIYLALALKAVGVALATSNLVIIGASLLTLIGIALRIPAEERRLHDCYGAEWDEYAATTRALMPLKRR